MRAIRFVLWANAAITSIAMGNDDLQGKVESGANFRSCDSAIQKKAVEDIRRDLEKYTGPDMFSIECRGETIEIEGLPKNVQQKEALQKIAFDALPEELRFQTLNESFKNPAVRATLIVGDFLSCPDIEPMKKQRKFNKEVDTLRQLCLQVEHKINSIQFLPHGKTSEFQISEVRNLVGEAVKKSREFEKKYNIVPKFEGDNKIPIDDPIARQVNMAVKKMNLERPEKLQRVQTIRFYIQKMAREFELKLIGF